VLAATASVLAANNTRSPGRINTKRKRIPASVLAAGRWGTVLGSRRLGVGISAEEGGRPGADGWS
jgi:hypothetical protein